jgi:hypothetical protein
LDFHFHIPEIVNCFCTSFYQCFPVIETFHQKKSQFHTHLQKRNTILFIFILHTQVPYIEGPSSGILQKFHSTELGTIPLPTAPVPELGTIAIAALPLQELHKTFAAPDISTDRQGHTLAAP